MWAVGDVHGMFDNMRRVLREIGEDEKVIFLGDYIDRGDKIAETVEFVVANKDNERFVFLVGNHEQMMIDAMADNSAVEGWLINGGNDTYSQLGGRGTCEKVADFFKTLPDRYETENNYFVHGGMSPGVSFEKQNRDILLWYRPREDINHGKYLVHGHTPVREPYIGQYRANLDTGCVYGNGRLLTAAKFNGSKLEAMVQA